MIAGDGIFRGMVLLVLLFGSGVFGVGLCFAAVLLFIRKSTRLGLAFLGIGSLLMGPALAVIHKSNEIKEARYEVEAVIPLETSSFAIHPKVYRDELGGHRRQLLWGELQLNVRLPNGGDIRGFANRISMSSTQQGKFASLQVFYEPDMAFYHAASVKDVFAYWKRQGSVVWDYPHSLRVDCGDYVVMLGEIGGYVTLTVTTDKRS